VCVCVCVCVSCPVQSLQRRPAQGWKKLGFCRKKVFRFLGFLGF